MDADMVLVQVNFCDDSVKYQMRSIMVIPGALLKLRVVLQGEWSEMEPFLSGLGRGPRPMGGSFGKAWSAAARVAIPPFVSCPQASATESH